MKKILLSLIMILVFTIPTIAKDYKTQEYTLLTLQLIDWAQTRDIATRMYPKWDNPGLHDINTGYVYDEGNPILGKHPSIGKVNNYFLSCIVCNYLISKYANKTFKNCWFSTGIMLEYYCVTRNIQLGIKLKV